MTEKLAWRYDPRIRAYYPDCRPHDAEQRLAELKAGSDNGGVFPNEWRQFLGFDPINDPAYETGYIAVGKAPLQPPEPETDDAEPIPGDDPAAKKGSKPADDEADDSSED